MSFKDHFSTRAATYAKARPTYPPALFAELARRAPGGAAVWDAGTGNGQAAVALAAHFERVVATEPSAAQLAQAAPHPRVAYHQSAETAPMLTAASVDLVTVACAVHWFDLGIFYPEVRRVLRPGGVIAVWNYALCGISPEIDVLLQRFYRNTVGPYWPPERKLAETNYRDMAFPFPEMPFPKLNMEIDWTLEEFTSYLRTWSAVIRYASEKGHDPVPAFEREMRAAWGPGRRRVIWPLGGRLGRI